MLAGNWTETAEETTTTSCRALITLCRRYDTTGAFFRWRLSIACWHRRCSQCSSMRACWLFGFVMLHDGVAAAQVSPADPCELTEDCRENGRCRSYEGRCVAFDEHHCKRSESCRDDGECFYDVEARHCDDGTERADTALFAAGFTVIGVGGLNVIAGALTLVWGGMSALGCELVCDPDTPILAGSIMMPIGALLALAVGLPMAVVGGRRVPRHPGDASNVLSITF